MDSIADPDFRQCPEDLVQLRRELHLFAEIDALKAGIEARERAAYLSGYRRGFRVGHAYGKERNGICPDEWPEVGWSYYRDEREVD